MAALRLQRTLSEHGAKIEIGGVRESTWSAISDKNVILLGDGRTNHLIAEILDTEEYGLYGEDESVRSRAQDRTYKDSSTTSRRHIGLEKYALLTRRPNASKRRCITIIAANHGSAIQGVAEYLTQSDMRMFLELLKLGPLDPMPQHFQAIFRIAVSTEGGESEIQAVEPIAIHAEEAPGER